MTMFDLAAFDIEIERRNTAERPGDDMLLATAVRTPTDDAGITAFGATSGTVVGALALVSMIVPAFFGGSPAEAMTFNGMTLEQFSLHMNMSLNDPLLVAMFEELCMV